MFWLSHDLQMWTWTCWFTVFFQFYRRFFYTWICISKKSLTYICMLTFYATFDHLINREMHSLQTQIFLPGWIHFSSLILSAGALKKCWKHSSVTLVFIGMRTSHCCCRFVSWESIMFHHITKVLCWMVCESRLSAVNLHSRNQY